MEGLVLLALLFCAVAIYFLPALVAGDAHPNRNVIFLLILFLGWTFAAWVVCLVWALMKPKD